ERGGRSECGDDRAEQPEQPQPLHFNAEKLRPLGCVPVLQQNPAGTGDQRREKQKAEQSRQPGRQALGRHGQTMEDQIDSRMRCTERCVGNGAGSPKNDEGLHKFDRASERNADMPADYGDAISRHRAEQADSPGRKQDALDPLPRLAHPRASTRSARKRDTAPTMSSWLHFEASTMSAAISKTGTPAASSALRVIFVPLTESRLVSGCRITQASMPHAFASLTIHSFIQGGRCST